MFDTLLTGITPGDDQTRVRKKGNLIKCEGIQMGKNNHNQCFGSESRDSRNENLSRHCLSSSCVIVAKLFFYADAPACATGRFERRLYAALACPMPTPGQGRSPSSDMIFVQYFTLPDFTP